MVEWGQACLVQQSWKGEDDGNETEKFARYMLRSTLEVSVLASQNTPLVEIYRRSTGWQQELFTTGQTIKLEHLNLELPVDAIYEDVL